MNKIKQISTLLKILSNYRRKRVFLRTFPIRLWIESTNICNLKCIMCLNEKLPPEQKGYMDFDLYKKLIDEAKDYVYDIYLHHRGEPLLHAKLEDMIRYAKDASLKVKFHTNGTVLNKEISYKLIDSGLDLISFSFDGFSKEPYEKIRRNARFEQTVQNISEFLELKKKMKRSKPYTIIEEIEMPEFEQYYTNEMKNKFSERFRVLGLDELIFKKLYNWAGDLEVSQQEGLERSFTMCTFLWYSSVVLWDGTVVPCPQDYFGRLKMGNIKDKRLKDIWNDKSYIQMRKQMISSVDNLNPCNRCDRLYRKKVIGLPFQYMLSFLNDNIIGYGKIRKLLGSYERNE